MKRLNEGKQNWRNGMEKYEMILRERYSYQTSQNKDYAEIKNWRYIKQLLRVHWQHYLTWGLTKAQIEKLDKAHRKQLRKLWNNPR